MDKVDTIDVIRSILSVANESYSIYNLNKEFKRETGIDIPLYGYSDIRGFLLSIPQTVKVTGTYPAQHVSLVVSEKSAHIVSLVKRTPSGRRNPKCKSRYYESRECQNSLIEVETNLEESGLVTSNKDPIKNEIETAHNSSISSDEVLPSFVESKETIPLMDIKHLAPVGDYIEICPCQIFSPHRFYFHFRKMKKKFSKANYKFQEFYKLNGNVCSIKNSAEVKPKKIFVAFYELDACCQWYRVEVLEIISKTEVLVWFIDYGTSGQILIENLKYLLKEFRHLPRQAMLGSLANIKPSNSPEWSQAAIEKFKSLALNKELVAGVVAIDTKVPCVWMALTCTEGLEIHINDALAHEGYAQFEQCAPSHLSSRNWEGDNVAKPRVFYFTDISCYNNRLKSMFMTPEKVYK